MSPVEAEGGVDWLWRSALLPNKSSRAGCPMPQTCSRDLSVLRACLLAG